MKLSLQTLKDLAELIHRWSGLVIGPEKAYLVRHRLEPLVRRCGFEGFDELLRRLGAKGQTQLHDAVLDAITTKETSFFRDAWFFEALSKHVLPEGASVLQDAGCGRTRIRIWSAGSSTGQESYSLAMLVREFIDSSNGTLKDHQFSILASDISGEALNSAKEGLYSKAEVERGLPQARLSRHCTRRGHHWVVNDSLRRLVQFRQLNLMQPPADLGAFDLVLCRNVMIYFDEPTRRRLCRNLHRLLQPGGWLAVGAAESLPSGDGFHAVKFGRAILYRKSPAAG